MREAIHGWAEAWRFYRGSRSKRHGAGASSIKYAIFVALCARCIVIRKPWLHPHYRWPWRLWFGDARPFMALPGEE
jgi:hypothetical protein